MSKHARYNASEKGRARHARYDQSEKGLARRARYRAGIAGIQANTRAYFKRAINDATKRAEG